MTEEAEVVEHLLLSNLYQTFEASKGRFYTDYFWFSIKWTETIQDNQFEVNYRVIVLF